MTQHILIWLVVTILAIVALPSVFEPATYVERVRSDQKQLREDVGETAADYIIVHADETYTRIFEDSGMREWFYKRFKIIKTEENELFEETVADKAGSFVFDYVNSFFISMYETIYRLTQLMYWGVFSLPFIIAAGFDGLMQRQIKNESFQYTSPSKYNLMWHTIIAVFAGAFIYCTTPFAMPSVAYPLLVFVAAMNIRELLSNLQRSA